jgi:hypothetical protein
VPKYVYRCLECEQVYEIIHSFGEAIETCLQLNEHSECTITSKVQRIPQHINLVKKENKEAQVGQVVNDFIDKTKEEIKTYKQELQEWTYKK